MIHNQYGLDFDDLKELCKGRLHWRKCCDCDSNGQQYWDDSTGEGLSNTPSGINPENLSRDNCETCFGLGYHFYRTN
jgi:hypothetical protein